MVTACPSASREVALVRAAARVAPLVLVYLPRHQDLREVRAQLAR